MATLAGLDAPLGGAVPSAAFAPPRKELPCLAEVVPVVGTNVWIMFAEAQQAAAPTATDVADTWVGCDIPRPENSSTKNAPKK
mmetsp:Transcript_20329/g.46343  ORF Transcript_20329/g.46343 Transcript_20329/m.46343 type:complete len:83 (-) Transcript_20329:48-296(-)